MAKALRTAAFVVGAVALVATGVGAAAGAGLLGATTAAAGASAATVSTLATVASVASIAQVGAAALSIAASIAQPKGSLGGSPTEFTIDKESGLPYAMGRTYSAGKVIHRQFYGSKNSLESWVAVHSIGPIKSLGAFQVEKTAVPFVNRAAQGTYAGYMWLDQQLGACPEGRALQGPQGSFPGWTAASKLSGLAADLWTLKFDSKGKKYPNGVPERGRVVEGVFVYDARLDSTYPGGSGPCRLGQEETYVYSECPANHALTWAYGRVQNGTLVAGGGMKVSGIDIAPFVEWANVCDANGWKVGGIVYTTADNSWDILKMICQAGGGEPMPVGGQLSVTFNAPRVSIGTITSADIIGDVDVPGTASRRARRNTVIAKVRLESHGWQVVPLTAIAIPDYVAVDGGSRPREIEFPLVQQVDQGAQLGLYEILNGRELEGILLPCKATMIGYRPGDCLTVDIPEAALIARDVVVRNRELDMSTVGVTFTCRSETAAKHSFALGKGGTAPPTPDLSIPAVDLSAPSPADWSANGTVLTANGVSIPAVIVTGGADDRPLAGVLFEYRPYVEGADPDANWSGGGLDGPAIGRKEITSVTSGTQYEVAVRYMVAGTYSDRLVLGPVTAGVFTAARAAHLIVRQSVAYPLDSTTDTITVQAFTATIDDGRVLTFPAQTISGLDDGSTYLVLWNLDTSAFEAVPAPALEQVASDRYVIIREMTTSNADGTYPANPTAPGGDGGGGYGGGGCPVVSARILLANVDRTGPGETIAAGDVAPGMWVWTQRETEVGSDRFGAYRVTYARTFASDLCAVDGRPLTSPSHFWGFDDGWSRSDVLGTPAGRGDVVAMGVAEACTYVVVGEDGSWHLSHNKRAEQPDAS